MCMDRYQTLSFFLSLSLSLSAPTVQRQFEAYLSRVITISAKPKPASNQSQPKPSPAVQSSTTPYSAATPTSTATPPTKSESTEPTVESSKVTHPPSSPDDAPTQSPLAAALKAKKGDLKPTEVRTHRSIIYTRL